MIRLVVVTIAVLAPLVAPAVARAQGQDTPLGECRVFHATNRGAAEDDRGNRTGFYLVNVEITCDDITLYADEVRWTAELLTATGHVFLQQQGLSVAAERLEWDRATRRATFYQAVGWAKVSGNLADRGSFNALEADLQFSVEKLERIGPRTYKLTNGWWSSCAQPVPRWEITTSSGTYVVGERLIARNAVLRVKKIPVFYTPIIYYPLGEDDRSTGFLMPTYTASSAQGSGLSNAFFWAIDRSQDVTFYHNWFSKAGQGAGAEYRFASGPGSGGQVQFNLLDEHAIDRRTYTVRGSVNQRVGRRFQLIGRANYSTDQLTQQLYQQNVYDFSQRERYVGATLSGTRGRYRMSATAEQRDIFQGAIAGRQGRAPSLAVTMGEKPLGRTHIYFGAAADATSFIRQQDLAQPQTDRSLLRVDMSPTIRAPLSRLSFLTVSTAATLRLTYWTKSQTVTDGVPVIEGRTLTRELVDLRADVKGPVFAKIWTPGENGYADQFKHLIEPRISISWLSAFDRFNDVVQIDSIDTLVGGTTTITYGVDNRLLARRRVAGGGRGVPREILSVSITQSRYSNALAAAYDSQYHSVNVNPYSPIQVTASVTPGEGVHARFQMYIDSKLLKVRSYSASTTLGQGPTQLTAGWSKRQFIPELPGYNTPASATHFLNFSVSTHSVSGKVGGTYAANLDVRARALLQQRVVLNLNAQCCGVSLDFQTLRQGVFGSTVLPADRRFGIAFSLAGLGSFSNPFGSFGDNSGRR